jgi:hypothetical protein
MKSLMPVYKLVIIYYTFNAQLLLYYIKGVRIKIIIY